MNLLRAVSTLHGWFGDNPFEVRYLSDAQVERLAELTDNRVPTDMGRRSNIGRWLTGLDGHFILSGASHYSISVVRWADQTKSGIYRIRGRTEETHQQPSAPVIPKQRSLLLRLYHWLMRVRFH